MYSMNSFMRKPNETNYEIIVCMYHIYLDIKRVVNLRLRQTDKLNKNL